MSNILPKHAGLVAAGVIATGLLAGWQAFASPWEVSASVLVGLRGATVVIEALALLYGVAFMASAVRYLVLYRRPAPPPDEGTSTPPENRRVAVLYLCCGDLEPAALESLSRLEYDGPLVRLLHDDSAGAEDRRQVDRLVAEIRIRMDVEWQVLRRPDKEGGKSAVTNFVLEQTAAQHDLLLLADNDSFAHDRRLLVKAARLFDDGRVAAVQFRNVAEHRPGAEPFNRLLGGAIDMFDAFMTGLYRGLWQPFVGHNAVLRTRDLLAAGGFTPGVFADDIDLTVRMNRNGKRVLYRRDLRMSEYHPPNYRSFCERSCKWSTGCAQVLRMHGLQVLLDRRLTLAHKTGFFLFCGFYLTQAAIIAYVTIVLLVLPLLSREMWQATGMSVVVGTLLPVAIFFPVIAFLRSEGRHLPFWKTLAACTVTYGSTDWWTLRGLARGLSRGKASWIPTNRIGHRDRHFADWTHFGFGVGALVVPWAFQPELLLFPITWLFAAKLIFVPFVAAHYRETGVPPGPVNVPATAGNPARRMPLLAIITVTLFLSLVGAARAFGDHHGGPVPLRVQIDGPRLLIDGEAIIIKGVHYSPWRPRTGPGKGFPYPGEEELRADLDMIRKTGANTILVYEPSEELVALAPEYGLNLIHTFHIEWWQLPAGQIDDIASRIAARVDELKHHTAIIAWMLGNEVDGWVLDEMGPGGVSRALGRLRNAVRRVDATRPVCHGKFALHRTLGLDDEMDFVAYNIYPFYPTEVAVSGFREFLTAEIMPLAGGRPVLITEFGLNTLEASEQRQAEVLRDCWEGLLAAGCQGGVVFAFADEWWKNYDNPILEPDWWRRQPAPNDHLRHDRDPEEHYGIVSAEREPKPAYYAVQKMFGGTQTHFEPVPTPALDRKRRIRTSVWLAGGLAVLALSGTAVLLHWRANERRRGK